uniref:T9SS type A sorting domain-containing protein n=1 Tax=uncultured Draconibacterium sp. TaxID=1573823 RepID=UPI00321796E4
MKKIYSNVILFVLLLISSAVMSQTTLVVEPGLGTLNAAIEENGGNVIYELTAGKWYGLDAPIENADYHLQIIGGDPEVEGGMPATLQTGSNVNGAPFGEMFNAKGNITLKNIYFVNADLMGQVASQFLVQSKTDSRIIIDGCILHPAAIAFGVNGQAGKIKTYFTNNQVIDHGHQLSPNDGQFFSFENNTGVGLDTLFVENNTFVCIGMNLFTTGFNKSVNNVVNFNHNTFVFSKSQIDWCNFKMEEYWTNNLMFDVQTQFYANNWQPMPGGDASMPKPNLIYADTLVNEVLPSTRPNFVQYNAHYRAQGFYDLIDELNAFSAENGLPGGYLYPLVWPKDTISSREAQMFNSSDFPYFQYGNTITDVDPEWTDQRIYEHEAAFIEWTKPASYIHGLGQPSDNYPAPAEWAQYWWIPSGDLSNNSVWPVFDGTYSNTQLLHGSIEKNIPLGDLNWFPEAKAVWAANKEAIEAHIKSGNTNQIDIGYFPTDVKILNKSSEFTIYPNPATDIIKIGGVTSANVKITSMNGRHLKTVNNVSQVDISDLPNGIYLVTIIDGENVLTQKLSVKR